MSFRTLCLAAATLCASTALVSAADLYTPEPAVIPAPAYQEPAPLRGGFHIGLNAGYASGTYDVTVVTLPDPPYRGTGPLLGGQVGYDYYGDGYMVGVEGDVALAGVHHDTIDSFAAKNETNMQWLATLRGRIGLPVDDAVFYATGGLAVAGIRMERGPDNTCCRAPGHDENVHFGWTIGAGAQVFLTDKIALKGEYLYVDLSEERYKVAQGLPPIDTAFTGHFARVGVDYYFNK